MKTKIVWIFSIMMIMMLQLIHPGVLPPNYIPIIIFICGFFSIFNMIFFSETNNSEPKPKTPQDEMVDKIFPKN